MSVLNRLAINGVLTGKSRGAALCGDCIKLFKLLPAKSLDVVCGSPPYVLKGERYGADSRKWPIADWVPWMVEVTREAIRVVRNCVIWIVNGSVQKGRYLPACEGLVWRMYELGYVCERPVIWYKNSAPNRKDWFVNDWEFCLVFRPADSTRFWNGKLIATPPKYESGGDFRQRGKDGQRRQGGKYPQKPLTSPRDVIITYQEPGAVSGLVRATVGGGHMGSKLACENEAPYPEKLVKPLLQVTVPQGGSVGDPFCGSATTLSVAEQLGLQWVGFDIRQSQVDLAGRRIAEVRRKMADEKENV
jgi:site-specific DNA-methyltransferase (adenine-specific)